MNEQLAAIMNWLAQAIGAGIATGVTVMTTAGVDVTHKATWAAGAMAFATSAWAHLRESPLPSTAGSKP